MTTARQLWVLLAADPTTGAATRPVGVAGVAGHDEHVAWIPLEPAAETWHDRVTAPSPVPLAARLAWWAENANGRTLDLAPLDPPDDQVSLPDAVETALDQLLTIDPGR